MQNRCLGSKSDHGPGNSLKWEASQLHFMVCGTNSMYESFVGEKNKMVYCDRGGMWQHGYEAVMNVKKNHTACRRSIIISSELYMAV